MSFFRIAVTYAITDQGCFLLINTSIIIFLNFVINLQNISLYYGPTYLVYNFILQASGDLSDLVMERLSCGTMYDFLDYLHPDSNYHVPHIPQYQHYRRTFHINTGFILLTSILLLWANVIIWCLMTIFMVFRT